MVSKLRPKSLLATQDSVAPLEGARASPHNQATAAPFLVVGPSERATTEHSFPQPLLGLPAETGVRAAKSTGSDQKPAGKACTNALGPRNPRSKQSWLEFPCSL